MNEWEWREKKKFSFKYRFSDLSGFLWTCYIAFWQNHAKGIKMVFKVIRFFKWNEIRNISLLTGIHLQTHLAKHNKIITFSFWERGGIIFYLTNLLRIQKQQSRVREHSELIWKSQKKKISLNFSIIFFKMKDNQKFIPKDSTKFGSISVRIFWLTLKDV